MDQQPQIKAVPVTVIQLEGAGQTQMITVEAAQAMVVALTSALRAVEKEKESQQNNVHGISG